MLKRFLSVPVAFAACLGGIAGLSPSRAEAAAARPGPVVLYEKAPRVPELSVRAPFRAKPLLVSGTDAYRRGEYLYQDYLFDDRGANTVPGPGTQRDPNLTVGPTAGDVLYPSAKRFANNAADLVEFRVRPTRKALVYRITLNALLDRATTAVGIGIDFDQRDESPVAWPHGAGIFSPGLDAFITAWGTGGEVALRSAGSSTFDRTVKLGRRAVRVNIKSNQMTIRVPRALSGMNPGAKTWRYVGGVGLWGKGDFLAVQPGSSANPTTPVSGGASAAPAIFNLAFRFDEPQGVQGFPMYDTAPGYGGWFEAEQARTLATGSSGRFIADIDFRALGRGESRWLHRPGRDQSRIHASRAPVHEGFDATIKDEPSYGGRLQPYVLHLPPKSTKRPGLVLAMHGNTATHTQFTAISPHYLQQIGDERNSIVLMPLGRDTRGAGTEFEFFEAWADVKRRFGYDPRHVDITGYSAGGYETFVRATRWPDLFAKGFAIVAAARLLDGGVPGDKTNYIPMLGNLRWVPMLAWNQAVDELAPYVGIRLTRQKLDDLGLRSQVWTFGAGEHFTPGALDQWDGARDWLGRADVEHDPSRVDYAIAPVTWQPKLGLAADHAYWVSGLRLRDPSAVDETNTARGYLTAISHAFGQGQPQTSRVTSVYPGPPSPATIDGTDWASIQQTPTENALDVELRNLNTATIAGHRARLSAQQPLTVRITSDGSARVHIDLPLAPKAQISRVDGPAGDGTRTRRGATLKVGAGTTTFRVDPPL